VSTGLGLGGRQRSVIYVFGQKNGSNAFSPYVLRSGAWLSLADSFGKALGNWPMVLEASNQFPGLIFLGSFGRGAFYTNVSHVLNRVDSYCQLCGLKPAPSSNSCKALGSKSCLVDVPRPTLHFRLCGQCHLQLEQSVEYQIRGKHRFESENWDWATPWARPSEMFGWSVPWPAEDLNARQNMFWQVSLRSGSTQLTSQVSQFRVSLNLPISC